APAVYGGFEPKRVERQAEGECGQNAMPAMNTIFMDSSPARANAAIAFGLPLNGPSQRRNKGIGTRLLLHHRSQAELGTDDFGFRLSGRHFFGTLPVACTVLFWSRRMS